MTAERRRVLFESIRERMIAAGFGFEDDPAFLDAVEKGVAGELNSAQLRQEYLNLLYSCELIVAMNDSEAGNARVRTVFSVAE